MRARLLAAPVLCAALAACAGGTTSVPFAREFAPNGAVLGAARATPASPAVHVTVRVTIQSGPSHARARSHFISRSTDGVLVQVYAHSDPQHRHVIGESSTDVSSGAAACGGHTGYPRSCTVDVPAPAGDDDFVFTTYDVAPKGHAFPGGHVLGLGSLTQRIVAYRANDLAIYIGGEIASIDGAPARLSFPADGRKHAYAFVLSPQDFNDNPIVAGKRDPYANPIAISLAQSSGEHGMSLSLDGAAGATSIVSRYSDDSLVLHYDGSGSPGYDATVVISAKGVSPQRILVSPLFVTSTSPFFAERGLAFIGSAEQATLAITQAHAPASLRYTARATGCTGIAAVGQVAGSGASATVVASNGATVSATGCTIEVSDGSSTVTIPVTNTESGGNIGIPNVTIYEFPIPSANAHASQLTAGADGAIWFAETAGGAGKIGRIPTNANPGSGSQITEFPTPTAAAGPFAIVPAPDGALWFTERGNNAIGRIPTNATPGSSAQVVEYPLPAPFTVPQSLIVAFGNLWFTDQVATDAGVMNLGGGVAQTFNLPLTAGGGMAVDAAGNVWIAGINTGSLYEVAPNGAVTTFAIPPGSQIQSMAFDAAGNLWMADGSQHAIDELPSGSSAIVPFTVPASGSPAYLTIGPDGAIWFTDTARNVVGRMTTAGVFAPAIGYAIPTSASQPAGIVNGPDGELWLVEFAGNNVAKIVPSGTTAARHH
jgi:virginiamycin B lyase